MGEVDYAGERALFYVELPDVEERRTRVNVSAEDVERLDDDNSYQAYAHGQ